MSEKAIKLAKVPNTDQVAIYWNAPPPKADTGEIYVEPSHFSIPSNDDPKQPDKQTHFAVADLVVETIEGHDVRSFTRAIWTRNGGYPPESTSIRPPAFPQEPIEARLQPKPAAMRPSPALQRRTRAVTRAGTAQDRLLLKAELEEEQAEFDAWLEERKSKGC